MKYFIEEFVGTKGGDGEWRTVEEMTDWSKFKQWLKLKFIAKRPHQWFRGWIPKYHWKVLKYKCLRTAIAEAEANTPSGIGVRVVEERQSILFDPKIVWSNCDSESEREER